MSATLTVGKHISPTVLSVGDDGVVLISNYWEYLDFSETTAVVSGTPHNLFAAYAESYVSVVGGAEVALLSPVRSITLPAAHGTFRAITRNFAFDDLGFGYPHGAGLWFTLGNAFVVREGAVLEDATALATDAPGYRDWVVGASGTVALVSTTSDATEENAPSEVKLIHWSGADLHGVASLDGVAWAVGDGGTVMRCDPTACETVSIPNAPNVTFRDVAAVGELLYIVGDEDTILSYLPRQGTLVNSSDPSYGKLVGVSGFDNSYGRRPVLVLSKSGMIWQRPSPSI